MRIVRHQGILTLRLLRANPFGAEGSFDEQQKLAGEKWKLRAPHKDDATVQEIKAKKQEVEEAYDDGTYSSICRAKWPDGSWDRAFEPASGSSWLSLVADIREVMRD